MKYALDMSSGAIIYMQIFINIGSVIQKLMGGIHRHRQHRDLISLLLFFLNKGSRLKGEDSDSELKGGSACCVFVCFISVVHSGDETNFLAFLFICI
jgi:hypothetical protein